MVANEIKPKVQVEPGMCCGQKSDLTYLKDLEDFSEADDNAKLISLPPSSFSGFHK